MSNKDQSKDKNQNTDADRSPPVGALLRASRLRVGEDLRQVAESLCIRHLYLEAIEDCRYEVLPGSTYAVGFIRTYAEHLGLDGDEVVRRYRAEQVGKKSAADLAFPTPVQDSGVPKGAIVFIGVLIALFVYGGWYVTTTEDTILSDLISPVPDHLKKLVDEEGRAVETQSGQTKNAIEEPASQPDQRQAATEVTSTAIEKAENEVTAATEPASNVAGDATASSAEQTAAAAPEAKPAEPVAEVTRPVAEKVSERANNAAAKTPDVPAKIAEKVTTEPLAAAVPDQPAKPVETAQPEPVETAATSAAPQTTPAMTKTVDEQAATSKPSSAAPLAAKTPEQAKPVTPEVTAEDLNTLVLRQATAVPTEGTNQQAADTNKAVKASGIVIQATASSWVEIRNPATNAIIFTGLMNAGKPFSVPDIKGLTLDTGNAGALIITVDGVEVPKIGNIGDVRKNVALDVTRLKAGTALAR